MTWSHGAILLTIAINGWLLYKWWTAEEWTGLRGIGMFVASLGIALGLLLIFTFQYRVQ